MRTIFTHSGLFHGDDVMAVAILNELHPCHRVARVRELPELGKLDIAVDIGGVYNPDGHYDHHQGGLQPRENGCPYAAAGLVWKELGVSYSRRVLGEMVKDGDGDALLDLVHQRVDRDIIQGIDARDCGAGNLLPREGEVEPLSLSAALSAFNQSWSEPCRDSDQDYRFRQARSIAGQVLKRAVRRAFALEKARDRVLRAETRGPVLVLEEYVPWQEHIYDRADQGSIVYVVFPSLRGGWCVQQVPVTPGSFEGRKPFPENWRGKKGKDLAAESGLYLGDSQAVFCHPGGFIAGAETRAGAKALADCASRE